MSWTRPFSRLRRTASCDDRGEWTDGGEYLAFGLEVSNARGAAPLVSRGMGSWSTAYPVKVALKSGKSIKAGGKKYTAVDCATDHALRNFLSESDFFHRGTFTGPVSGRPGEVTLTYGAYEPEALRIDGQKNPLVIWLHGMGEGGTDVSIELMGNEVVALIRNDIQSHFTTEGGEKGAYVLAVQCPTYWMDSAKGMDRGSYTSIYSDVLKSCIDHYLEQNPDVDPYRVYIGGCSNGGYMTMNMVIRNPHFFAAAYPTCEAYEDVNISDVQIQQLDMAARKRKDCGDAYFDFMRACMKNSACIKGVSFRAVNASEETDFVDYMRSPLFTSEYSCTKNFDRIIEAAGHDTGSEK